LVSTSKLSRERTLVIIMLILYALAFGVYLVNTASPTPLAGLSPVYVYSIVWWVITLSVFIGYAVYDLRRGG